MSRCAILAALFAFSFFPTYAASSTPMVVTIAGSKTIEGSGTRIGPADQAMFFQPAGMAFDKYGNLYVADSHNHRICKISRDGMVSVLCGDPTGGFGKSDGKGTEAKLFHPFDLAYDPELDVLYVADTYNNRICKVTLDGTVTTLAGWEQGYADGKGKDAQFNWPHGIELGPKGLLYIADTNNHRIRVVTRDGVVTTLAGSAPGYADGRIQNAKFSMPFALTVDQKGNIYVSDTGNHCIRKISIDGTVTTIAGDGSYGAQGSGYYDGKGKEAQFDQPMGIAVDKAGNVYVADTMNHRIRKIAPDGTVTTIAGSGDDFGPLGGGYKDGPSSSARFKMPYGLIVDPNGDLIVGDTWNHKIRKIILPK
jgi:sugar lactone lactonase YvrE